MDTGETYGYVRVSTKEQNEERQLFALLEAGVPAGNILADKQSGKDFNRPMYQKLLKKMKPGDTLFIKSIDRLGRDYDEIVRQWRIITKERKVFIVVLDIPLLDTRENDRDLTGIFIADLVLQILSYVAQTEREFIRQRQAEGIGLAKARGIRFGRPPLSRPEGFEKLFDAWRREDISARFAAKELGVSPGTFQTWARDCHSVLKDANSIFGAKQENAQKSRLF
jgi:DNA invertase Pin-like site-specific DNA recombinase